MQPRVRLYEYTPKLVDLSYADQQALLSDFDGRISILPTSAPGVVELNPGSFVGVVRLPSGVILDLLPKVPLFNVMWMIAEVERLEGINYQLLERDVQIATFEDILEPIARVFVEQVEHLVDRGLYRAYIEQEDNLTAIRGRIDFREDVNRNVVLRHRTYCRFTEFSWDVPENQVIRQVLRQLASWGFSRDLTNRLVALDRQLEDVHRTTMRASDIDRLHYSRQSEHYRPIHRFCRLFLQGLSLSEGQGETPFDGFLMNMNVLFEQFVAIKLQLHLTHTHTAWHVNRQSSHSLDQARSIQIIPDLVLEFRGRPVLIGDTKYKKLESATHKLSDLYQMITYCTVLGLDAGMLIYPRHLVDIDQRMQVQHSPIDILETSVDLRASRGQIEDAFAALAIRMVAVSQPEMQHAMVRT